MDKNSISEFSNFSAAVNFRFHCLQFSKWTIVMGDDNMYWLVTNRHASLLEKNGYKIIEI